MLGLSKQLLPNDAGFMPRGVLLAEQVSAALRAYLDANELEHYTAYHWEDFDLPEIDEILDQLNEQAEWRPIPALTGGEPLVGLESENQPMRAIECGALHLARHAVLFARWLWLDSEYYGARYLWLVAAPSPAHIERVREEALAIRRARVTAHWQIVRGAGAPGTYERVPRESAAIDDLILSESIRDRIRIDAINFFAEGVAELYRSLGVPYRRGVLMHGPPGNGKTSIIRWIGSALPDLPMMLLRPRQTFDTDDLEDVLKRWREQAPAALVIEDLDWLLERINVSTFLNSLDGVETRAGQGLLLIATTNHPERLDPAVNNRPGRFDVVIEVPLPDDDLRRRFLARKLPATGEETLAWLVRETRGLAFCHLIEIVRLSGMIAISAGRRERTDDDLQRAARLVGHANTSAEKGFAPPPDEPFGLHRRGKG
jgi:hypothetical protein